MDAVAAPVLHMSGSHGPTRTETRRLPNRWSRPTLASP